MTWETVRRSLASPVVWTGLVVDLTPLVGVLLWGWGAAPLVMLYWIENLVIGLLVLPRIVLSAARFGPSGLIGGSLGAGLFLLHYGLFCAVHGTLLVGILKLLYPAPDFDVGLLNISDTVRFALAVGPHMVWVIALLAVWRAWAMTWRFFRWKEWRSSDPMDEMFGLYLPIGVLHGALLVAAIALALFGDPLWGALVLIGLRVIWGVWCNVPRPARPDKAPESADPFLPAL